jgi:exo-1,4-beta-D-glucosaminidase
VTTSDDRKTLQVRLQNDSKALAFQVAVAVRDAQGEDIAPATWSDNYVELMPGEARVLRAALPSRAAEGAVVVVSGWNIAEQTLHLSAGKSIAAAVSPAK